MLTHTHTFPLKCTLCQQGTQESMTCNGSAEVPSGKTGRSERHSPVVVRSSSQHLRQTACLVLVQVDVVDTARTGEGRDSDVTERTQQKCAVPCMAEHTQMHTHSAPPTHPTRSEAATGIPRCVVSTEERRAGAAGPREDGEPEHSIALLNECGRQPHGLTLAQND